MVRSLSAFAVIASLFFADTSAFGEAAFFGRDFDTYKKMFCLSDDDFKGKAILDLPAGPSTFLSTLKEKGLLASGSKAVDSGYHDKQTMAQAIEKGMKRAFAPYFDKSYLTWEPGRRDRFLGQFKHFNAVHSSFLDQFEKNSELYVKGDIRKVGDFLRNGERFDLVLSSNLLFLYADDPDVDEAFHRTAILSLSEAVKDDGEIRIFPLDTLSEKSPTFFEHLMSGLADEISKRSLEIKIVDGCMPSTGQLINRKYDAKGKMLVIRKKPQTGRSEL